MTFAEYNDLPLGTVVYLVDHVPIGPRSFVGALRGVKGITVSENHPPRYRVNEGMFRVHPDASHVFLDAGEAHRAAVASIDIYVAKRLEMYARRSTRTALAATPRLERNATQMRERCHEIKDLENVI